MNSRASWLRVRMRKRVAQVQPDLAVVGMRASDSASAVRHDRTSHDLSVSCTARLGGCARGHGKLGAGRSGAASPAIFFRSVRQPLLERRDLVEQLDFGRHAVRALQDRERDAQMLRQLEIAVEIDRLPAPGRLSNSPSASPRGSCFQRFVPGHRDIFSRSARRPRTTQAQRRRVHDAIRLDAQRRADARLAGRSARRTPSPRRSPAPRRRSPDRPATRRTACRACARLTTAAASVPTTIPAAVSRSPSTATSRTTDRGVGAERHADADLLRALRDGVRNHAVQPGRRHHQRDRREREQQPRSSAARSRSNPTAPRPSSRRA